MINNELLINLDKLHTTQRGAVRIKRNLSLDTDNVVGWCKTKTSAPDAVFKRIGKNWYVTIEGCTITVNAHSFTIITAHREKEENKVMSEKYTFQDFLASVDGENQKFVSELHDELTELGCKIDVKSAKSGYVVSYRLNKKTIANYVFRKKGLIARIYAGHIAQYMEILDTLPDSMVRAIQDAPICKRLVDPSACNPKCSMGYDFILQGERLQRCRNNAFMFLLDAESRPFVKSLLLNEASAAV